jgi:hypothetical protein
LGSILLAFPKAEPVTIGRFCLAAHSAQMIVNSVVDIVSVPALIAPNLPMRGTCAEQTI